VYESEISVSEAMRDFLLQGGKQHDKKVMIQLPNHVCRDSGGKETSLIGEDTGFRRRDITN
jgi:hypothetical protein